MTARPLDWLDPRISRASQQGERVAELATRVANALPARLEAILSAHPAQPSAAAYDAETVSSSIVPDPTANAAIRSATYGDPPYEALRQINRNLQRAWASLDAVVDALVPYTPRKSTDYDRSLTTANAKAEPGCTSCARTEVRKGVTRWEPIHRNELCRWCYDFTLNTGLRPNVKQLDDHHAGRKVRRTL